MEATIATSPTVVLFLATDACAFNVKGEIVCAPIDRESDTLVAWDLGTLADHRGAGGVEGYKLLHQALVLAEDNVRLTGVEVVRLPS